MYYTVIKHDGHLRTGEGECIYSNALKKGKGKTAKVNALGLN